MKIYPVVLLGCLALGHHSCCSRPPPSSRIAGHFAVEVLAQRAPRNNHCFLKIALTNVGTNCLSIDANLLPWRPYAMTIVLVQQDVYSTLLERRYVIADSTPGPPVCLKAGRTLYGEIDLSDMYPELDAVLKQDGVSAFWSYALDVRSASRVGGWLPLPRQ